MGDRNCASWRRLVASANCSWEMVTPVTRQPYFLAACMLPAPAAADFENVITGSGWSFFAKGVVFGDLRLFETDPGRVNFTRGMGHRGIDHGL